MELVFPAMEHKQAAMEYRQEFINAGEAWIHGSAGLHHAEDYEAWLEQVISLRTKAPPGFVTGDSYFAIEEGRIVGMISIRHALNESLMNCGGHVGYGVRPTERRKGYGAAMLALALEQCRALGILRVLVTCDKNNIASAGTIKKNGGILENEVALDDGTISQRYWISL